MNTTTTDFPRAIATRMGLDARYFEGMTADRSIAAADAIHQALIDLGVSFEGRRLPISLRPTILSAPEVDSAGADLAVVRDLLNRILIGLVADIRADRLDAPLPQFFGFYRPWFPLIAAETRVADHIMLMRFDAVATGAAGIKVMEPNAACPGGVIHCAYIRDAWRRTDIGRTVLAGVAPTERPCDSPDGLIRLLYAVSPTPRAARIVLCNYKGVFSNELDSLCRRNAHLRSRGEVDGEIVVCDIREIEVRDGRAWVAGQPIDVVYNKVDQLMIDPQDPDLAGWIEANRLESCEFLNSLAALYVGEAKSIFGALWDEDILAEVSASDDEIEVVRRRAPRTRMMLGRPNSPSYAELTQDRYRLVVKADALTRGAGVHVGRLESADGWGGALFGLAGMNPVIQDVLDVPRRESVSFPAETGGLVGMLASEHWGVDFFFYGDVFAGVVGRCHSSMIFNVGNGGQEVPTFVVA